ncbi:MAG: site-specific integrase [Opitutaceae bacterium]|nr:site-specific integrase [Opitutaceae bacterium]
MISYVFRRIRNGQKSKYYTGRYSIKRGEKPCEIALHCTDEKSALAKLHNVVIEAQREAYGIIPSRTLRDAAAAPLGKLVGEYEADLLALGRDAKHVHDSVRRVRVVVAGGKWKRLADITPPTYLEWRAGFEGSAKTLLEYQNSVKAWLNWLVETERMERNPLKKVKAPETRGKGVQPSRALTLDELRRLFAAARPEHRLAYKMLAYTGQRCCEIAALVWGDVELGEKPFIRVRDTTTKDKDKRAIPLHPELAAEIVAARVGTGQPDSPLIPRFPTLDAFHAACKRAGIVRIDALGRRVHMHALRKTFQTMGVLSGVNQRAAQDFLGHSDANLTAKIYTDIPALGYHAEIAKLPWAEGEGERPTGEVTKRPKNRNLGAVLLELVETLQAPEIQGKLHLSL